MEISSGLFKCMRCGNNSLLDVTTSDYERIVTGLDQRYHAELVKSRMADVRETHPIKLKAPRRAAAKRKTKARAKSSRSSKPAKQKAAKKGRK